MYQCEFIHSIFEISDSIIIVTKMSRQKCHDKNVTTKMSNKIQKDKREGGLFSYEEKITQCNARSGYGGIFSGMRKQRVNR